MASGERQAFDLQDSEGRSLALLQAMEEAVEVAAYKEGFPDKEALLRSDAHQAEPYIERAQKRFPDACSQEVIDEQLG